MTKFELKTEKSTLRFLTNCLKLVRSVAVAEFGPTVAAEIKIILSRKLYFALGSCYPERKQISYNLAWLVMNKSEPEVVKGLLVHELMHIRDRTHGPKFVAACAKYGVKEGSSMWSEEVKNYLPPASWIICIRCGHTQGLIFKSRLTPAQAKEKLSNIVCGKCGGELEYRQLSDRAFKNLSARINKLRLYNTESWKALKDLTK